MWKVKGSRHCSHQMLGEITSFSKGLGDKLQTSCQAWEAFNKAYLKSFRSELREVRAFMFCGG